MPGGFKPHSRHFLFTSPEKNDKKIEPDFLYDLIHINTPYQPKYTTLVQTSNKLQDARDYSFRQRRSSDQDAPPFWESSSWSSGRTEEKKSIINKLSLVEEAKNQVRQQIKARQREIAERHIQKSVNKAIHVLNSYVVAFNETDHYEGCDPFMEKIRLIAMMYAHTRIRSRFI